MDNNDKTISEITQCQDLNDLKTFASATHIENKIIGEFLGVDAITVKCIKKFINENCSIEYLKCNYQEMLDKHKDEVDAYIKKEEKQIQYKARKKARKKAQAQNKAQQNFNYDDYDDYDVYDDIYIDDDDFDYGYHPYRFNQAKYEAIAKNEDLVYSYESFKHSMCNGKGQRKVKLFLNKKIKAGDDIADLYRLTLEIENTNINAKKYRNTSRVSYKDLLYEKKEELIKELLDKCYVYNQKHEDQILYGYQSSNNYSANKVIYFELPGVEQISFHSNISKKDMGDNTPKYTKDWDEKINSTIFKIEDAINKRYGDEL